MATSGRRAKAGAVRWANLPVARLPRDFALEMPRPGPSVDRV